MGWSLTDSFDVAWLFATFCNDAAVFPEAAKLQHRILPPVPMTEIVDQTELIEASCFALAFGRGSEPI